MTHGQQVGPVSEEGEPFVKTAFQFTEIRRHLMNAERLAGGRTGLAHLIDGAGEGVGGKNRRAAFSQAVRLRKNARLVFLWLSAAV